MKIVDVFLIVFRVKLCLALDVVRIAFFNELFFRTNGCSIMKKSWTKGDPWRKNGQIKTTIVWTLDSKRKIPPPHFQGTTEFFCPTYSGNKSLYTIFNAPIDLKGKGHT